MVENHLPRALTIAGSDSGGGAGIQADLKTFAALGVYGMSVITSLTAQNTLGVQGILDVPAAFIGAQFDAVMSDIGADAAKTGIVSNAGIIEVVTDRVRRYNIENLVVDPVMRAKDGTALLAPDALDALIWKLLPLALVVTPNLPEAEVLIGAPVKSAQAMKDVARRIHDRGVRNVLLKGGHLDGTVVTDVLFDGSEFHEFSAPRIETKNTHGTGCVFSAAIAAGLAKGLPLLDAVGCAKTFVTEAIRNSLAIGHGHGPVNPMR
ncbi:MAG: bifunctional hydroxymethylpyrimidine kinase/phosphomethylpyrimidine kinase [bacterium]